MNKLKYVEKKYLSTYELSLNFFNELGISVNDITPLRKVFLLKTSTGNKILKKVDYSQEKLEFINNTVNEIEKEFKNIIRFNRFSDGKTYKEWNGDFYIVMDLIEGREAAFTNPIELNICGEILAKMHLTSKKVIKDKGLESNIDVSFKERLINAVKDFQYIKELINKFKFKNEFDSIFYENVDEYIKEIDYIIKELDNSKYDYYRNNIENLVLCHNDLAQHNFIYSDKEMYLIDFDYASIDLRVMDISDIILKGIKNAAFDVDKGIGLIKSYDNVCKIEKDEYKLIYLLLSFPRDICSLARAYYFKEKDWDYEVFLNRLKIKIENDKFRTSFLEKFKDTFL